MNSVQPLIAASILSGIRNGVSYGEIINEVLTIVNQDKTGLQAYYGGLGVSSGLRQSSAMMSDKQIEAFAGLLTEVADEPFRQHTYLAMLHFYYYKNKEERMLPYLIRYKDLYGEDQQYLNARIGYVWIRLMTDETPELLHELDGLIKQIKLILDRGGD